MRFSNAIKYIPFHWEFLSLKIQLARQKKNHTPQLNLQNSQNCEKRGVVDTYPGTPGIIKVKYFLLTESQTSPQ